MNKLLTSVSLVLFLCCSSIFAQETSSSSFFNESPAESKWIAPPPVDANNRVLLFDLQAAFQHDEDVKDQAFSMLDLSLKRPLDENSILADGLLRFRKNLSNDDQASSIDLRLARISYLEPWIQVTLGRFDLFQNISSNHFFGAYPVMGLHRVDGIWVSLPINFFFSFGPAKENKSEDSSPLALSFFYTPSLFSAQQVQYDNTQTFWLSQLKFRLEGSDFSPTLKLNFGGSASDFFDYSSLNGSYTASISTELIFRQNYSLTVEASSQNIDRLQDTGVIALGLQASRLGTWGSFSLDQISLEAQLPIGNSLLNPFTGGNAFSPNLAQASQAAWYAKIRARLKVLFIELHLTNNQNDYTLARPAVGAIAIPFSGAFGPGNETDGAGTLLRASSYNNIAAMIRTGVEF
ncbi:MAG TPA: hypothetical protein VHE12_00045 [bacterium]|nr:hypothetical protein [bacterium]